MTDQERIQTMGDAYKALQEKADRERIGAAVVGTVARALIDPSQARAIGEAAMDPTGEGGVVIGTVHVPDVGDRSVSVHVRGA